MKLLPYAAFTVLLAYFMVSAAGASGVVYGISSINTTVSINLNGSAYISEAITTILPNSSLAQYTIDRSGLNLTLSNWQAIVGPQLVQHIINPRTGVYAFHLLPGPVNRTSYGGIATIYMNYYVYNVTTVNQTGPRVLGFKFNDNVLNFAHGSGGVVLGQYTRFNIILPKNSRIISVYPLPDYPSDFAASQANISEVSWFGGEPLYNFNLVFQVKESLLTEVKGFFGSIYAALGIFTYIIVLVIVLLIIFYTYMKVH